MAEGPRLGFSEMCPLPRCHGLFVVSAARRKLLLTGTWGPFPLHPPRGWGVSLGCVIANCTGQNPLGGGGINLLGGSRGLRTGAPLSAFSGAWVQESSREAEVRGGTALVHVPAEVTGEDPDVGRLWLVSR